MLIRERISNSSEEIYKSVDGNLDVATASSTLVDNTDISYRANNFLDNSASSTYPEGVDRECIGEWVEISTSEGEAIISKLGIVTGLCKSDEAYYNNNRVKSLCLVLVMAVR